MDIEALLRPLTAVLDDPARTFTVGEVYLLMRQAIRYGYTARIDEEQAVWPPRPVFAAGDWVEQMERRRRADADRTELFAGGLPSPSFTFPAGSEGEPPVVPAWMSDADRRWLLGPDEEGVVWRSRRPVTPLWHSRDWAGRKLSGACSDRTAAVTEWPNSDLL